jgi:Family of unknown function (DUF6318)
MRTWGDLDGRSLRWLWPGPAVVVCLVLVGCSSAASSPAPTVVATPTVTPSPSASPAPTLPPEAQQPTQAGAVAFFRYYIDLYNYSFKALDATELKNASDPECVFCESVIENVRETKSKNQSTEGGLLTVIATAPSPGKANTGMIVAARLTQAAGRTTDVTGMTVTTVPPHSNVRMNAGVRWKSGQWILIDVSIVSDDAK